eukprot:GHRQ01008025.1.p1 GENE.GHRQ01008025.1~~GHRQ01008025.1.p1  ORF type:complete len:391 (+),score=124.82 GHRQ01008025.1:1254-2426(+)
MKQPCSLLPTLSVDVVHLPEPIFLHILGLNKHDRRWARQVCKAARDALSATTAVPAAASLPLWAFQWMWKHQTSVQQSSRVVSGRAAGADLAALTWLKRSSTRSSSAVIDAAQLFGPALCAAAAGAGHIHVLQWLRTQRSQCPWDFTACTAAARTPRNLHTLVWLRQQQPRCPWAGSEVWEAAAASGCFETLHWLQSQRCPGFDSPSICAAAAGAGQVAVLQWLQQQRPPCTYDESAVAAAAAGGHVSVLQWLKEREGPHSLLLLLRHTSAECTAAAAGGHLQALHFLREVLDPPCPFSTETAVAAASGGHLAVLQYLDQQQQEERYSGTCWIPAVCAAAAAGGHLHVLQWLRNELDASCPWDPSTCRWVAWQYAVLGAVSIMHLGESCF